MLSARRTELPWQKIGIDLFELEGNVDLIVVDYFSIWFETLKLFRIDASTVIEALKNIFAVFGILSIVVSNIGLHFNSLLFKRFSNDYDFAHILSDPFHEEANGCAERAVQVAKRLLKQSDPLAAVMAYRSTPLEITGCSQSQLLIGRNIRTKLITVTLPHNLTPHWSVQTFVRANDERMKRRTAESYSRRKGARPSHL